MTARAVPPPPRRPDPGETYRESWNNFVCLAIVAIIWLAAVLLVMFV